MSILRQQPWQENTETYRMSPSQQVLNTQEAATLLGVHKETVRRLARKGALPCFKIGKDWRFRRDALLQWMELPPKEGRFPQPPCLLVIDDDPGVRKLLRNILEKQQYKVLTAAGSQEGLTLVDQHTVQLVLLDLKMPGMSGPEVIRELKKKQPHLPVIIVTGFPDSQMMMEVYVQCPVMLIPKPIDKEALLSAVSITLEGSLVDHGEADTATR